MLFDEILHLFLRPSVYRALKLNAVLLAVVLDDLVCAETLMALFTIHKRIREASQMSGCDPGLRVHQDGTVNTYVVRRLLNEFLPPCALYVILKLYTKVAVIPSIRKTSIDLRTRVNKSSCFCQSNNLVHCFFHDISPHCLIDDFLILYSQLFFL